MTDPPNIYFNIRINLYIKCKQMNTNKSMSEFPLCVKEKDENEIDLDILNREFSLHRDILNTMIKEAFKMFDEDGSGEIDAREFRKMIRSLGMNMSDHEINEMIQKIDKNKSGYIDLDEFTAVMMQHQLSEQITVNKHLELTFNLYDKDQDGIITKDDLIKVSKEIEDILNSEEASLIISFTKLLCIHFKQSTTSPIFGINKEEFYHLLYNLGFIEDKIEKNEVEKEKKIPGLFQIKSRTRKKSSLILYEG